MRGSFKSSTPYTFFSTSFSSMPTAAPAGDTCLKEAAAGRLRVSWSSLTRAYEFKASKRLIYPGEPQSAVLSFKRMSHGLEYGTLYL